MGGNGPGALARSAGLSIALSFCSHASVASARSLAAVLAFRFLTTCGAGMLRTMGGSVR